MRSVYSSVALFAAIITSVSLTTAQVAPSLSELNIDPPQPLSTICGDIVNANLYQETAIFYASDAVACLTSIPFNAAVATRFLQYYNQTLSFQSTLPYIKNPPQGYQQPAYDLIAGLAQIQAKVDAGYYRNEYVFEAEVQLLSLATHDSHTLLSIGALAHFTFGAPFNLVAVSPDGKETPQIFVYDDLVNYTSNDSAASPIQNINGLPVARFLEQFAAEQSFGMVEPDADWNQLMISPAQLILGSGNAFTGGATFYPGDNMTVKYQNGTDDTWYWMAIYCSPGFTGPLDTGGDFYNLFVLGLEPASFDASYAAYQQSLNNSNDLDNSTIDLATSNLTYNLTYNLTSWNSLVSAYPADTISHQQDLGPFSSGFITGYFASDIDTAIISIPSFFEYEDGIDSFSQAIDDFINNATQLNATYVIIDLQQNLGGQESLVFDTFRQFFPSVTPFAGSRLRSHHLADEFGQTLTNYFNSLQPSSDEYDYFVSQEWVVTDRINAQTGQNFTSWQQFFGPLAINGDAFSLTEQYNLSSNVFINDALDIQFPACFFNHTCEGAIWPASNIILLTDGNCGSSCSLFVEMMTQSAPGIRTVVVGGRPQPGPMQAASGSRGARAYTNDLLDYDAYMTQNISASADSDYFQLQKSSDMQIYHAGVNLRDQIRPNATTPNQFLYLPADCRIFWSMANWNDYDRLWHDAWNGIYNDTSYCVPRSRNATSPPVNSTAQTLQRRDGQIYDFDIADYIEQGIASSAPDVSINGSRGYLDDIIPVPPLLVFCDEPGSENVCRGKGNCRSLDFPCRRRTCKKTSCTFSRSSISRKVCIPNCVLTSSDNTCSGSGTCKPQRQLNTNQQSVNARGQFQTSISMSQGFCIPPTGSGQARCTSLNSDQDFQNLAGTGG